MVHGRSRTVTQRKFSAVKLEISYVKLTRADFASEARSDQLRPLLIKKLSVRLHVTDDARRQTLI